MTSSFASCSLPSSSLPSAPSEPPPSRPQQSTLAAWFAEHNALYLLSAALVLGGVWLISREVAPTGSWVGSLGVGALAELYALSLVAGAGFLTRLGQRRPAVMLSLLAALYQMDPTLHAETCSFLGSVGLVASGVWALLYLAKLRGLCWALQLKLSRGVWCLASAAGLGLAWMPHAVRELSPALRSALVCTWVFGLFAGALFGRRQLWSAVPWDPRARRCVKAAWVMWGGLLLAHVLYWVPTYRISLVPLVVASPLLCVAFVEREIDVWGVASAVLSLAWMCAPGSFPWVALAAACTLFATAYRGALYARRHAEPLRSLDHPYRTPAATLPAMLERPLAASQPARGRLVLGGLGALYLAQWHAAGSHLAGGASNHSPWALLALSLAVGALAWRLRKPRYCIPVGLLVAWAFHQRGLLPLPHSPLQWGITSTVSGFAALALGLVLSWRSSTGAGAGAGHDEDVDVDVDVDEDENESGGHALLVPSEALPPPTPPEAR